MEGHVSLIKSNNISTREFLLYTLIKYAEVYRPSVIIQNEQSILNGRTTYEWQHIVQRQEK
jgi:hypothetical protein